MGYGSDLDLVFAYDSDATAPLSDSLRRQLQATGNFTGDGVKQVQQRPIPEAL